MIEVTVRSTPIITLSGTMLTHLGKIFAMVKIDLDLVQTDETKHYKYEKRKSRTVN